MEFVRDPGGVVVPLSGCKTEGQGPLMEGLSFGRIQRLRPSVSLGAAGASKEFKQQSETIKLRLPRRPLHCDPLAGGCGNCFSSVQKHEA